MSTSSPLVLASAAVGGVLLLLVGFVLIYQIAYGNRVYPGVKALGNDLGGYSRDEAALILQRSLDQIGRRQLAVRYGELSWTLTAQELGLKTDLAPILDSVFAVGREGNLFGRFWTQFGLLRQGRSFEHPSAAFDPVAQTALLERLAREVDRPMVEARLTVKPDFTIDYQPAQSSRKLDQEASRQRIQQALASPSQPEVELAVHETMPRGSTENLVLARDQASRILSAPIVVKHEQRTWTLDRAQLASIMRFSQDPGVKEAAYLDRPALEAWSKSLADVVEQEPQDARFAWAGGALETIRPSRDGVELNMAGTVDAIVAAAASDQREIPLVAEITKPAVSVEERHNLGIKELIESSKTGFAGASPAKRDNITLAASRLNGTVVPPGATFSFNKEIGSTSLDAGFKLGWGITSSSSGVKTVPSVAGGICQVSTTLFHSVFWAGFPIEQRNWHLYWIPSYTSKGIVGLDSTVDEESGLDFQFINPHETHLLIQSWVDGASINFALYGTRPPWTVKVGPSDLTDLVSAERGRIYTEEEQTMPEGQRLQVESANDGFVVTTTRTVIEEGKEDRVLKLVSRYKPSRNVILVGTGGKPPSGRSQSQQSDQNDNSSQNRPAPAQAVPSTNAAPTAAPKTEPAPKSAPAAPKSAPDAPKTAPAAPKKEPAPTAAPKPKPGTVATPSRPPVQPATAPQTKPAAQQKNAAPPASGR